jgi:predicted naringenin-chalcone synthase
MSLGFCIAGVGTSAPQHVVEQWDAAQWASQVCGFTERQQRLVPALYRRSGVRVRHSVLLECSTNGQPAQQSFYPAAASTDDRGPSTSARMRRYEAHAPQLALEAAQAALQDAATAPQEITHLVTASCSGFCAPGIDIQLIHELGLPATTARTHVGFMGCHGALNALRVAKAFADGDPAARVLLCAVELCTLHHQYGWNPERIVSNALFADGAAALVGWQGASNGADRWRVSASGTAVLPESADCMSWRIGDNGFEMDLSARVPEVIAQSLRPWLEEWLESHGLNIDRVASWAVHPGGPRILQACTEAIGLKTDRLAASYEVLAEFGNMSSPTVLFVLDRLRMQNAPRPCVLVAFGPGMVVETALVR